jgi:hypothetical protein
VTTNEVNIWGTEKEAAVAAFSMVDGIGLDISFKYVGRAPAGRLVQRGSFCPSRHPTFASRASCSWPPSPSATPACTCTCCSSPKAWLTSLRNKICMPRPLGARPRPGHNLTARQRWMPVTCMHVLCRAYRGGVTYVDSATNQALFGEGATPAKLLKGEIQAPPQFAALYELLNQIEADA